MEEIEIARYTGNAAQPFLEEIARLRISVFREFPYLYDGTMSYEMDYLSEYFAHGKSLLVVAKCGSRIVGVSTGIPLAEADEEFRKPFSATGADVSEVFYFGESVLLPEFRGRGIGHRFFDERESWAAECGFRTTGFCSVIREPGHPLMPADYRPHDSFWQKRGYMRQGGMIVRFPWKQIGDDTESLQELAYWLRDLDNYDLLQYT
jgi:GNAT superfamily N-acetyltransferase